MAWLRRRPPLARPLAWTCTECGHEVSVTAIGDALGYGALLDAAHEHLATAHPTPEDPDMPATVHPLPVPPHAHVTRARYDSDTGEWTLTVSEDPAEPRHANPDALPPHVHDALATFARD